mgnify:CR=1 FL=1
MPTIQEAIKHPAFKTLPPEEQKKVFSRLSPEYNGLPPEEQDKVINRFSPTPALPQPQIESARQEPDFKGMVKSATELMVDLNKVFKSDVEYFKTPIKPTEQAPSWAKSYPKVYSGLIKAKDVLAPTAQSVANVGGMALGPLGPGLMNMQEQAAENLFDTYMGRKSPTGIKENLMQYAKDFAWGKTFGDIEKGTKGLFRRPTPEALVAKEQAEAIGVKPLPSEIRESKTLANLEAGMGRLFGSSSILTDFDRKNVKAIVQEAKNIAESSGTKIQPEDLGRIIYDKVDDYLTRYVTKNETELTKLRTGIQDIVGRNINPVKLSEETSRALLKANQMGYEKAKGLYGARDALIPKEGVPLHNAVKAAEKWKVLLSKRDPTEVDSVLRQRIDEIIGLSERKVPPDKTVYENLWAKPSIQKVVPKADLQVMQEFRSNINADLKRINPGMRYSAAGIKGLTKAGESLPSRAYAELANAIERDINAYSRKTGVGLLKAQKEANTFYGQFKELSGKLSGLLKEEPERVLDRIQDVADVRLVKKSIGQDKFNNLIKPAFTQRLLGEEGKLLNPEYTQKVMSKYANVLPEVYTPQELKMLKDSITKGIGFTGNPMNKVDSAFLKKIVESYDPKAIIESFYTTGKSKYAGHNFRLIYHIVGQSKDKTTQAKMRYFLAEKILMDGQQIDPTGLLAGSKELGGFSFNRLSKNIQNNEYLLKMMTGKEGFTQETIDKLKRLVNVGKYMQSIGRYAPMTIKETGQSTWAMSQLIASIAAIKTGNIPGALGILFGPAATTALYIQKPVREALISGLPKTGMVKGIGLRATRLTNQEENQPE